MGDFITLTAEDGHNLQAYEAGKNNPRKLVLLQEIFGVNHHIRAMCDRFAQEQYHVIAPALFDRIKKNVELAYDTDDFKRGAGYVGDIPPEKTLLDIKSAANKFGQGKIGVVGYCWGGSNSWIAATQTTLFAAASAWYGSKIYDHRHEKPNCPVQMHFGGKDPYIPLDQVHAIEEAQPDVPVYIYPEADHGFGCSERQSFNKDAYTLAQQRTLEFFKTHL